MGVVIKGEFQRQRYEAFIEAESQSDFRLKRLESLETFCRDLQSLSPVDRRARCEVIFSWPCLGETDKEMILLCANSPGIFLARLTSMKE